MGCHALLWGNLPNPGIEPRSPAVSRWQADSLPSEPPMWAKPGSPGLQLAAPAVRCFPDGSGRRGVSAQHTSSWADVKVVGAEGVCSPSCREVPAHSTDDAAMLQTAGSECEYSFSHPSCSQPPYSLYQEDRSSIRSSPWGEEGGARGDVEKMRWVQEAAFEARELIMFVP